MGNHRNIELLDKIGSTLKHLREKRGLSQEDVINDTGIHIGRIEIGSINLTISTLFILCEYYEVSLNELFQHLQEDD